MQINNILLACIIILKINAFTNWDMYGYRLDIFELFSCFIARRKDDTCR
jgi:hypothetical protein